MIHGDTQLAVGCMVETSASTLLTLAPALSLKQQAGADLNQLEALFAKLHNLSTERLHDIRAERQSRALAADEEAAERERFGTDFQL